MTPRIEGQSPSDFDGRRKRRRELGLRKADVSNEVTCRQSLEQAIAYIQDDELVEVTPETIRLRKRLLDPNARKKAARAAA